MDDSQKTLKYLIEVEKLAEDILSDKQSLIVLDRKRNENREALRALGPSSESSKKCFLTVGGTLVKYPTEKARQMLVSEQVILDTEINKIRSELKVKINHLRDLEYKPPVPGLMLVPLSSEENSAFKGKLY